jgi:toxin FitB
MIVLDTNVVAEMMAKTPNPSVLGYLNTLKEPPGLSAITIAEVRFGIELLPNGRRKRSLSKAAEELVAGLGPDRILSFSNTTATCYADVVSRRRRAGRPISQFDGAIAASCIEHKAKLVTRNIKDFENLGIDLVNPWDAR